MTVPAGYGPGAQLSVTAPDGQSAQIGSFPSDRIVVFASKSDRTIFEVTSNDENDTTRGARSLLVVVPDGAFEGMSFEMSYVPQRAGTPDPYAGLVTEEVN